MVRGQARVIRTLIPDSPLVELANQALPQGTILVLPVLLPSWAAAAWSARALVTDSGGALSHGAILARERGVPAVVGTGVATRTITDGQELWVDAERGLVYLIPPAT
jgi:pyruvate,water dikinase